MCERIKTSDGVEFVVCGIRRQLCIHCRHEAKFLCDWKVKGRRGTCDRPICAAHAREVAPDKHLCGEHSQAWDDWQRRHGAEAAARLVRRQPEQMSLL